MDSNQKDKKLYGHPTIKPLHIVENLIVNSSQVGQIVLDPFVGSGSTCIAAINTNRHYIAYELDETYFEIARQRIDGVKMEKGIQLDNQISMKQTYKKPLLW